MSGADRPAFLGQRLVRLERPAVTELAIRKTFPNPATEQMTVRFAVPQASARPASTRNDGERQNHAPPDGAATAGSSTCNDAASSVTDSSARTPHGTTCRGRQCPYARSVTTGYGR